MNTPHSLQEIIISRCRSISVPCLLATLLVPILVALPARAATDTWTDNNGTGDANWATGTNWSDAANAAPSAYDQLVFTGTNGLTNTNNFSSGTAFDGIIFSSTAGAFTLNGNGILISGQINGAMDTVPTGIMNNSTSNQTVNLPVALDWGTYLFSNASTGADALNGGVTVNAGGIAGFNLSNAAISSTEMTVDSAGLITGLDGAALIETTGTGPENAVLATLPLAALSGTNIVALPVGNYVPVANGGEISAVATGTSNVLLNPAASGVTYTANDTGNAGVTLVNTITQESGTDTIVITGTLVVGAGASNSVGGFYQTQPTAAANGVMVISGTTIGASNPTGWLTSGTTSSGGTIVFGINSKNGDASNEINENAPIINNPEGGAVSIVKTGPGSMNFHLEGAGDANYSGGTYVDQGLLQANATSVLGTGPIYVAGGATLYLETSQSNAIYISPGVGDVANEGSIKIANNSQVQSGVLTVQGAPVTSAPGDRISQQLAGGVLTFTNQVTGAGTLDLQTQATNAGTSVLLDNTTANANNWTGGTILDSNGGSDRLVVEDGASNQFAANGGTSAGNMTFTAASTTSGALTYNLNGFSDTLGALITNGVANTSGVFVNNSGATASTLTIGDNNGTGSFAGIIENTSSALNIVKTGTGTQTFAGPNTFTGSTTVNAGILKYTNGTAFGTNSAITVNGGTVQVSGAITGGNLTLTLNGSGASNATGALDNSSGNNTYPGGISLGSNSTISSDANTLTLSGAISGAANLSTAGAGTVSLTGNSTGYTGTTTVLSGNLQTSGAGSINNSVGINVNGSGARFIAAGSVAVTPTVTVLQGAVDGTGTINTVNVADSASAAVQNGNGTSSTLTIGNLTFNGAGAFNLIDSNANVPDINVTGALTTGAVNTSGIVTINVSNALGWINGTDYDLISFASLVADGIEPNDNLALGTVNNLINGQTAQLVITGTEIAISTSGGSSEKWTGLDSNQWVVGPTGPSDNWERTSPSSPVNFTQGDAVIFDDSASSVATSGTITVNIAAGNVAPVSTIFSNNAYNYVITSTNVYGISGGSLAMNGTGTLFMETANTYTGVTSINSGIINYQNGTAFGVNSAITVAAGATAQVQGNITSAGTQTVTLSGSGALNATGALENVSGSNSSSSPIVLAANSTVSSDSGLLTLSGGVTGPFNLTLASEASGDGAITLSGSSVNNAGTITNDGAGTGPVLISAVVGPSVTGITQNGPDTLTLSASNTYAGNTTITSGTLLVTATAGTMTPLGTSSVYVGSGGALNVGFTSLTIGNTISGPGTINYNTLGTGGANTTNSSNLSGFTGTLNLGPGGGKLQLGQTVAGMQISGSATINVFSGATLFQNGAPIAGPINLYGGTIGEGFGQIRYGNATTSGTITLFGSSSFGNTGGHTGIVAGPVVDNGNGYGITIEGGGLIEYTAPNTYSGQTLITTGSLELGNANAVQNSTVQPGTPGPNTASDLTFLAGIGTFNLGGLTGPSPVALVDTGAAAVTLDVGMDNASTVYSGTLSGIGAITKVGTGTLTLSGESTYSGITTLENGILNVGSAANPGTSGPLGDSAASNPGSIVLAGGTLQFSSANQFDYSGRFSTAADQDYYIDPNGQVVTFATPLSSSGGALSVNDSHGGGALVIASNSTYTGPTTVTSGNLVLSGSLNGTSGVALGNLTSGTAELSGDGYINSNVQIGDEAGLANSSIIRPGTPSVTSNSLTLGTGVMTVTGNVSIFSDGEFVFTLNSTGGGSGAGASELLASAVSLDPLSQFSLLDLAGTQGALTPGTAFTVISTTSGLSGTFGNLAQGAELTSGPNQFVADYGSDSLTLVVVPEPETWALMLSSFGLLIGAQKLRKRLTGIR